MKIMGIDQSFTGTGICIYDGNVFTYYLIDTKKTKNTKCPSIDYTRRIKEITNNIRNIIINENIELVGLEGMAYSATGSAIFDIGGLSHSIRSMLIEENKRFIIAPPTVIKKFWTGKGNANKMLMIETAEIKGAEIPFVKKYKEFPDKKFDDNVVDAHAICEFLQDYESHIENIECSWDV